ncbi:HAD family hydrolase [Alkalihalobacillus pseudalcaliphilus]|uniref:HAD family hydrolase n=1 Tax=Alkalihalobacillus pseudalcaliphilus TaxID=79884 RepID=UPI00069CED08|nr:HAD family hydrolase [Alkalihalobacillus pseudalcaliphilus]
MLVSFDIDDTLYNFKDTFQQAMDVAFQQLVKKEGRNVTFSTWFKVFQDCNQRLWPRFEAKEMDIHTFRELRFTETMKKLGYEVKIGEGQLFHDVYVQAFYQVIKPFPSVKKLLSQLHAKNVELAIISNGPSDTQYEKLRCLGLQNYFLKEKIFISEEVASAKPEQAIFLQCANQRSGEIHTKKYHIGDSWSHDVMGAVRAGWTAVYFNWKNEQGDRSMVANERVIEVQELNSLSKWFRKKG